MTAEIGKAYQVAEDWYIGMVSEHEAIVIHYAPQITDPRGTYLSPTGDGKFDPFLSVEEAMEKAPVRRLVGGMIGRKSKYGYKTLFQAANGIGAFTHGRIEWDFKALIEIFGYVTAYKLVPMRLPKLDGNVRYFEAAAHMPPISKDEIGRLLRHKDKFWHFFVLNLMEAQKQSPSPSQLVHLMSSPYPHIRQRALLLTASDESPYLAAPVPRRSRGG